MTMVKLIDSKEHQFKLMKGTLICLICVHVLTIFGFYYMITRANYQTIVWFFLLGVFSGFGILAGTHRLWCHRSYKARTPLRILLMIMQTMANQHNILEWCRDHRVHHKYSDTEADPYNIKYGFWWSQIVWLAYEKHPSYIEKCKGIDISDIESDPVVKFQLKHYNILVLLIWGLIPTIVPWYFWSEPLFICLAINMTRYVVTLHQTGLVNSVAHMYGMKPYDENIEPVESHLVTYLSMGEGYHNYHHSFPYDYSASEFGWASNFNLATAFIDFFSIIGLAYDKREAEHNSIKNKKQRTGDRTKYSLNTFIDNTIGVLTLSSFLWIPFILRSYFM